MALSLMPTLLPNWSVASGVCLYATGSDKDVERLWKVAHVTTTFAAAIGTLGGLMVYIWDGVGLDLGPRNILPMTVFGTILGSAWEGFKVGVVASSISSIAESIFDQLPIASEKPPSS